MNKTLPALPGKAPALPPGAFEIGYTAHDGAQHRVPLAERADLPDRALFAVDVDAAKLARRLRAGQPQAKTAAVLGEAGGAFYDAALDRCCELYVRAVVQVLATTAGHCKRC